MTPIVRDVLVHQVPEPFDRIQMRTIDGDEVRRRVCVISRRLLSGSLSCIFHPVFKISCGGCAQMRGRQRSSGVTGNDPAQVLTLWKETGYEDHLDCQGAEDRTDKDHRCLLRVLHAPTLTAIIIRPAGPGFHARDTGRGSRNRPSMAPKFRRNRTWTTHREVSPTTRM
jgi:hypothetical protein